MKALTTRKPIALTTTSLCSGAFTARIARSQRLHVLRVAGVEMPGWDGFERDVKAGLFRSSGLDVQTTTVSDAAAALAGLSHGASDIACTDTLTAIRACTHEMSLQFVAITGGLDVGYVGLGPAIDAKRYALARFARALRESGAAEYVDALALQSLADDFAAKRLIEETISVNERISAVAVMSGTR